MVHIYNSLTKEKELFVPLHPHKISMYVCGITVYDYCHLGHARMLAAFDIIVRYLRSRGNNVHYVQNITDIDDKIINRSQQNNEPFNQLTERFIKALHEDRAALNILSPDEEPRATAYMSEMIEMIQTLINKKHAYIGTNGDVYYAVNTFPHYGELAHQDLEKLRSGARVAITDAKHDPLDFVLWKLAKPGEPSWESPWGNGRPGWHIECSAMSIKCLGEHFDIHGGGFDLIFPHHQNEIAQSEGATGQKFVNIWMHNGFVQIDKEKMSKSLGNFFTIRDVLKDYSAETVRYFLISSHYRSPINYSTESLTGSYAALERFYLALRGLNSDTPVKISDALKDLYINRFNDAMDDDFNTPEALAVLFDVAREINRVRADDHKKALELAAMLRQLGGVLGILQQDPELFLRTQSKISAETISEAEVNALIAERNQARHDKKWQEADQLRDKLMNAGIIIEDSAKGTTWRRI